MNLTKEETKARHWRLQIRISAGTPPILIDIFIVCTLVNTLFNSVVNSSCSIAPNDGEILL
jgi:hypothetical protein